MIGAHGSSPSMEIAAVICDKKGIYYLRAVGRVGRRHTAPALGHHSDESHKIEPVNVLTSNGRAKKKVQIRHGDTAPHISFRRARAHVPRMSPSR